MRTTPLPALSPRAVDNLESSWTGILTPEMRRVLQLSCGLASTPLGDIDFTGQRHPEEALPVFRSSLTLTIDDRDRRWIAEVNKTHGLPGPVWCVFPKPQVALLVATDIANFLAIIHQESHENTISQWLTALSVDARLVWATRHASAVSARVAIHRLRELRGWLMRLPMNAGIYDLRASGSRRGLPYGFMGERGDLFRCGNLPVFALAPGSGPPRSAAWRKSSVRAAVESEHRVPVTNTG